ncbi:MAG TPA: Asp/Glu/hydantoin racemase, partial [Xanthobacteraceae bacterium]|nr:Asp/Glu/hydantoin racemase [Xanthobacteraceae bacterium]
MNGRVRLGFLTPSSNTVLEPLTAAILDDLPEVTAHFARFKVTEIALSPAAVAQFDDGEILRAAALLGDAKVDAIAWSGTSSAWLGFARDVALCERILKATGRPACTAVLALNEVLAATGAKRLGLVTPYRDDVQARIVDNYEAAGFAIACERHLGISDDYAFAEEPPDRVEALIREVAADRPDAIAILCTNMRGAPLVSEL